MKISNEFTVSASPDEAWKLLMDLEQVVPLMPGASYLGQDGEDFLGKVKIKVGPVTSEFGGKARFLSRDDTLRRALVSASGKEARGSGNASATITLAVHEAGENNSRVTVDTDMQIVGKLAQFGSGMIQQVSEKLLAQFVERLEAKIAGTGEEPETAPGVAASGARAVAKPVAAVQSEPEPIDLLDLADGGALLKYGPYAAVGLLVAALLFLLGRRSASKGA